MKRITGFTLVELMIVIAIIAIIGAIAVPAYQGYVRESRLSAMRMNLDTLRIAVEAFRLDRTNANYGPTQAYNTVAAVSNMFGWKPDSNAYAYAVSITSAAEPTYRLCAARNDTGAATDTWIRCTRAAGGTYSCFEEKRKKDGGTETTAAAACP
jgi:prepilin-type N-terminal cleavage/methylation domain-containing protein